MIVAKRIIWIDWAKAILIYLMVVGHCLPVKWQGTLIYAFHMPAFFVISGYLYKPHHWLKTLKSFEHTRTVLLGYQNVDLQHT